MLQIYVFSNIRFPLKLVMLYENCDVIELLRRGLNREAVVTFYATFPWFRFPDLSKLARNLTDEYSSINALNILFHLFEVPPSGHLCGVIRNVISERDAYILSWSKGRPNFCFSKLVLNYFIVLFSFVLAGKEIIQSSGPLAVLHLSVWPAGLPERLTVLGQC